jgi:hypothetical protein
MGPGRKGPHAKDLEYALTTEGDLGSSVTIIRDAEKLASDRARDGSLDIEVDVRSKIISHIKSFNEVRGFPHDHYPTIKQPEEKLYRRQSLRQLEDLSDTYKKLIEVELPIFEKHGYNVEEIYIGSCDLSADCSLRGHTTNGKEFDIAVDLQEDGTISEAMGYCISELANAILTDRLVES